MVDTLDPITRGGTWTLFIDTPGVETDWDATPVEVWLTHVKTRNRVKLRHLAGDAPYDGVAVGGGEPGVRFAMAPEWTSAREPGYLELTVAVGGEAVRNVLPAFPRVLVRDDEPLD